MATIQTRCPSCGYIAKTAAERVGTRARCGQCEAIFSVVPITGFDPASFDLGQNGGASDNEMFRFGQHTNAPKPHDGKATKEALPRPILPVPPPAPQPALAPGTSGEAATIRFACPKCRQVIEVGISESGNTLPCLGCGQRLRVPSPQMDKAILGELLPSPPPTEKDDWYNDPDLFLEDATNTPGPVAPRGPALTDPPSMSATEAGRHNSPPSRIQSRCPSCGHIAKTTAERVGTRARCRQCKTAFSVVPISGDGSNSGEISPWGDMRQDPKAVVQSQKRETEMSTMPTGAIVGICLGGLFVVFLAFTIVQGRTKKPSPPETARVSAPTATQTDSAARKNEEEQKANSESKPPKSEITCIELLREFQTNASQARRKYNGRHLTVEGRVSEIYFEERGFDEITIDLDPWSVNGEVQFIFHPRFKSQLQGLKKGQLLTVSGRCDDGSWAGARVVKIIDCRLSLTGK